MATSSALTVLLFSVVLCTHGAEQRPPRGRHSKRDTTGFIISFVNNMEQRLTALEARRDNSTEERLAQLAAEMKGEMEDKLQVVQEGVQRLESKVSELLSSRLRMEEMVHSKANTTEERLASLEATKAESSPAVCRYQFQYQYEKEAPRHSGDHQCVAKLEAELTRLLEKVSALDKRLQDNDQSVGSLHNASVLAMEGVLHTVTELAAASEQVVKSTMKNATEFFYNTASMVRDSEARLLARAESNTALLNASIAWMDQTIKELTEQVVKSAMKNATEFFYDSNASMIRDSEARLLARAESNTALLNASIARVDQTTKELATRMSAVEDKLDNATSLHAEEAETIRTWPGDLQKKMEDLNNTIQEVCGPQRNKTCQDYYNDGRRISGVYSLHLEDGFGPMEVYCDMSNGTGWVVFQRREDGSVDFYRDWKSYEYGFGNLLGEFWLGNRKIHRLTSAGLTQLRVDLQAWDGQTAHASYSNFSMGDASSFYTLSVSGYSGNAGDSLSYHNGMKFSTHDKDNDVWGDNCAQKYRGAWWHHSCHYSNLNGQYGTRGSSDNKNVLWKPWIHQSLRRTEMKVK